METGVFARPDKCFPGCENPGLVIPKHKLSHERKAHFHDSENPCLQNPVKGIHKIISLLLLIIIVLMKLIIIVLIVTHTLLLLIITTLDDALALPAFSEICFRRASV